MLNRLSIYAWSVTHDVMIEIHVKMYTFGVTQQLAQEKMRHLKILDTTSSSLHGNLYMSSVLTYLRPSIAVVAGFPPKKVHLKFNRNLKGCMPELGLFTCTLLWCASTYIYLVQK